MRFLIRTEGLAGSQIDGMFPVSLCTMCSVLVLLWRVQNTYRETRRSLRSRETDITLKKTSYNYEHIINTY